MNLVDRCRAALAAGSAAPSLSPAFRAAVWVAMETEYDGGPEDRQRYARRTIERFVTQIEDLEGTLSDDDLDYLLDKLERYTKPVPVA